MTYTRYTLLASLLIDIECELRRASLWGTVPPSDEALASVEPFCVDTMDLEQWLQFVFLPRMHTLITAKASLPAQCNITSIAETVWTANVHAQNVIDVLRQFDEAINSPCA
jgi:uncharacterized protein YqcC (DUF446 family)